MSHNLTFHARTRMRQRSIPTLIVDWLMDYGKREFDKNGAQVLFFSKDSIRKLEREMGYPVVRRLSEFFNAYLVMTPDGAVITVGYRP